MQRGSNVCISFTNREGERLKLRFSDENQNRMKRIIENTKINLLATTK